MWMKEILALNNESAIAAFSLSGVPALQMAYAASPFYQEVGVGRIRKEERRQNPIYFSTKQG